MDHINLDQDSLDQNVAAGEAASVAPAADTSQIRVLLVEDESLIAEIIGEALTEHGYAVHAVPNAQDALEHLSAGSRIDLLFTDINLPGDIDGARLATLVRDMHPGLPVIYASGRWALLDELRGVPHSAILQKPYSPARACAAVEVLVVAKEPAREAALA